MANKEKLFEKQKELGDELIAIREKLSQKTVRSSRLPEITQRVAKIEAEFSINNTKLLASGITSEDYFEKGYYESLLNVITEIKLLIKDTYQQEEQPNVPSKPQLSKEGNKLEKVKDTEANDELWEQFTEMADWLNNWCDELSTNIADTPKTKLKIKEKFLETRYKMFQDMYYELKKSKKSKDAYYVMINVENTYFDTFELMAGSMHESAQQPGNINVRETEYSNSACLGKIEIPEFDGNINEWSSFHDLFKSLVHENKRISNVEKMYRLVSSLKGESKKLIQHLKITDNNYQAAFDILKQRYENRRLLFTNQVDMLLDQPMANSESSASLKQLLDTTNSCVYALKSMDLKIEDAEPFIARIVIRKLDKEGLRYYEQTVKKAKEIQSLKDILGFLEQQVQALEAASKNQGKKIIKKSTYTGKASKVLYAVKKFCLHCNMNNHTTAICKKILSLPIGERRKLAYNNKWCFKCLDHKTNKWCSNTVKCCYCSKGHHKILHLHDGEELKPNSSAMTTRKSATSVLLATAQIKVQAANGELVMLRALIDQDSQITTISEEAAQILSLPRIKCKTEIHGLGSAMVGISKAKIKLILRPRFMSNHSVEANALILPKLTGAHPSHSFEINIENWNNFILADPTYNKSDRVDIVIGGDIIPEIIQKGLHKKDNILAQSTIFGWILSGVISKTSKPLKVLSAVTDLERFWELEEISTGEECQEDKICEKQYEKTTKIDKDNRIVVKLPLREDCELGNSRKQAVARFLSLEKKLNQEPKLKEDYVRFMKEYLHLGHMEEVKESFSGKYYLPHQPVVRESSSTTKLRVVFDASAKTTNGKSLNDIMYTGPKLQRDLFDIIIKWRLWKYVISADIEKMYRQVRVAESDQSYQHILWRESTDCPIKEYKLTTVTYGMSSAPFLSVRSLFHIADNISMENELIKKIIKEDFYMDDLMTGANSIQQCKIIRHQIQTHLDNFGFKLRKWVSNNKNIVKYEESMIENTVIQFKDNETVKTLGLQWDPAKDDFQFKVNFTVTSKVTKRQALSDVAKIFDALGWISPVTVLAKLFIQKLWLQQSPWDEVLSNEFQDEWYTFSKSINVIQQIRIPRWVETTDGGELEIHGFSDASEKAYAAAVYIKQNASVKLLAAKTKVNPIKNKKTLPKLELCAAHLLSKLLQRTMRITNRKCKVYAWSDSTITLGWINNNKNKDKFIKNKVNEIKAILAEASWHHISSKDNPADIASRGITAEKLLSHPLWWTGPKWLVESPEFWPKYEEPKSTNILTAIATPASCNIIMELINKCSSLSKLRRIVAYILRFINKLKEKLKYPQYLTIAELDAADKVIIINYQRDEFHEDILMLEKGLQINNKSQIVGLFPFIDKDGILRVGGRLYNANLKYSRRHPIILKKSELSSLIIHHTHILTLHGGNRLMESTIKRKYWILGLKWAIKQCIRKCTTCIRYQREDSKQLMGNLPEYRVNVSHPFCHTGVDYAGPIYLKCSRGRGQKTYKGYIALFVCMATKAIHLEVVSDLTADAFLAALKRFFSRRGMSSKLYSDNGTNFVGANKKLNADFKAAIEDNKTLIPILAEQKIEWHFIPPAAPHFGGIWESGVKSMKYHLNRVIGETKLTFEEMSTLLSQIEAVLNSRPLVDLGSDGIDTIDVLTPGHFLIGRPLLSPGEHIEDSTITSLNRWKLIQKLRKDFWNRWKDEYLVTLQQRNKWRHPVENLKEGAVVLIKNENTHPARWPLARVIEIHKGKDEKVRVVKLKLSDNVIKRPIQKIIKLPISEESKEREPNEAKSFHARMEQSKRNILFKPLWMFMVFLLAATKVNCASLKHNVEASTKEISLGTALYLDHVGAMNIINSKWTLIIHYDLKQYYEEIKRIKRLKEQIENQCSTLGNFSETCEMMVWSINRRYSLLEQNNNSFLLKKGKQKRSPFEFVGSIYHMLFGMMDAEDRKLMEENMRNIFQNEDKLQLLTRQQTSIVNSTINVLKKTTEEVNSNFRKIYRQLDVFYEEVQNVTSSERLMVRFQVMITQLHLMTDEYNEVQSSIIDLLIDINHGHVNPHILTTTQLQEELLNIKKFLPDDVVLPGTKTGTELKEVYRSIEARGIIMDNRLVIQAEIPLYKVHASEIYEIIRLPVEGNGTAMIPIVDGDYIVYNFATNLYFLMWRSQLNTCSKNSQGQYSCKENFSWKPAVGRSCEVSALKQSRHAECYFQEVNKKSIWKKLSIENQWIFAVFDQFTLSVDCGINTRDWITLPSKGILNLAAGCTAVYEGVTLSSSRHFITKKKSSIQATSWEVEFHEAKNKLVKPLDVTMVNNAQYIQNIQQDIQTMQASNNELMKMKYHHVSGHVSFILIIVVIIILVLLYVRYKCSGSNKTVVKVDFSPPMPLDARQNVQTS